MTLIVNLIAKDKDFDVRDLEKEIAYPHNNLFGFERWRQTLWGHAIIQTVGCELIYSLSKTDVYVYDADIVKLKNELIKMVDNIDLIAKQTNIDGPSIEFRIKNALAAVEVAERNSEKVGVAIG